MDINNDGHLDIIGGSYDGKMYLYRGSEKGFLPQEVISEDPYVEKEDDSIYVHYKTKERRNNSAIAYVKYSNPTLGDYNGDGLLDIFVCGEYGPRVLINEGTAENPAYGERVTLQELDGRPINVSEKDERYFTSLSSAKRLKRPATTATDYKANVRFYDWDNDGVGDLIIATSYDKVGMEAISFYKGVNTAEGIKFHRAVPIFKSGDSGKCLPGKFLSTTISDVNGDGIVDLIIGTTMYNYVDNGELAIERGYNFVNPQPKRDLKTNGYAFIMYGDKIYKK